MSDLALDLLQQQISKPDNKNKQCLWVVDENISLADISKVSPFAHLQIISNRFDVYQQFKARQFNVLLNDFDFTSFERHSLDAIYYRVSKEKAIVHHIINCSANYLKPDGRLYISGYKNEGTKTYISKASEYLGLCVESLRGGKTSVLANIQATDECSTKHPLDDKEYSKPRSILSEQDVELITKPGVFGWNKIDQGSRFLIEYLPNILESFTVQPKRVADLGCGYGYLSVMASQCIDAEFVASDNNIAAVDVCRENFAVHSIKGSVTVDDCASSITENVDLVLCNPPFHQGFSVESDLTLKFLNACSRLLVRGGQAIFVVNSFIPIERKAADVFSDVSIISNNKQFKIVALKK